MRASLQPLTREAQRPDGAEIREFDLASAAQVFGALFGGIFLVFFLAAFLPWVLVKGMTAAVEGLMSRVGFGDFTASNIWSWFLVLIVGAAFIAFLVALVTGFLALYNVFSQRTGHGLQLRVNADPNQPALQTVSPKVLPAAEEERDEAALDDATFDELYTEAQRRNVPGRSTMSKAELEAALRPKRRPRKRASQKRGA